MILFKINDIKKKYILSIKNTFAESIWQNKELICRFFMNYLNTVADRKLMSYYNSVHLAYEITRRKSRELMVKRIPRGPSRNFMRDVVSTCANIHV